jgi:hypothetical protein
MKNELSKVGYDTKTTISSLPERQKKVIAIASVNHYDAFPKTSQWFPKGIVMVY